MWQITAFIFLFWRNSLRILLSPDNFKLVLNRTRWLIKWNLAIAECVAQNPGLWKPDNFDVTISSNLKCIIMIIARRTNCVRYAWWIRWTFLSLNVGRDRVYVRAPCPGQYTRCRVCIETYAILDSIKVSIHQIYCEATVNLIEKKVPNLFTFSSIKFKCLIKEKRKLPASTHLFDECIEYTRNNRWRMLRPELDWLVWFQRVKPTKFLDQHLILYKGFYFELPLILVHKFGRYYWTDIYLNTDLCQSVAVAPLVNWLNARNNRSTHLSIATLAVYYCTRNSKSVVILYYEHNSC